MKLHCGCHNMAWAQWRQLSWMNNKQVRLLIQAAGTQSNVGKQWWAGYIAAISTKKRVTGFVLQEIQTHTHEQTRWDDLNDLCWLHVLSYVSYLPLLKSGLQVCCVLLSESKTKMIFNIPLIDNHKHSPCYLDSLLKILEFLSITGHYFCV